jgi:histidine ammonia-lyase
MAVRANQLGAGGAGVAAELLDGLVAALNQEITPVTREIGSIGTGDLPALADVALAILGEGHVWRGGKMLSAWPLVREVKLDFRDALGFMSSNALTLGQAALLSVDIRSLQRAWMSVAALSFEAFDADLVVLDERVQAAVGAAGQQTVARRMRELLGGAALGTSAETPVQHPYPFRVLPQVDGVTEDALTALEDVVGRAINARGENALIVDAVALPNGNFHAAELAAALDRLRAALAQSGSLIAVRISAMMDPRTSGLPTFLSARPGLESGVMMLEYTAQSAAAHARAVASTVAVQTVGASLGVESHSSLAAEALRLTAECIDALLTVVATELVVTLRALELSGRTPNGAGAWALFDQARAVLPAGLEDRCFGADVELARELLRQVYWRLD